MGENIKNKEETNESQVMETKKEKTKEREKFPKTKIRNIAIISIVVVIIGIIAIYVLPTFVLPGTYINKIETSYQNKEYKTTAKYLNKLSKIKGYLKDDSKKYEELEYKVNLASGITNFDDKKYEKALEVLENLKEKSDEINSKINDAHYELGKELLEKEQYQKALEHLEKVTNKDDAENLLDKTHFNVAIKKFENKDYSGANDEISKVKNTEYENFEDISKKIHYEYGKQCFEENIFEKALEQFELSAGYEDSDTYKAKCAVVRAENLIKDGKINEAKTLYDSISDDLEFNGIQVGNRKNQINEKQAFLNIAGEWKSTKEYLKSEHVWRYDGSSDYWYQDDIKPTSTLKINAYLNEDGSVSLKGTVGFYAYNSYSSIGAYCVAYLRTRNFEVNNVNEIPGTINLDENTNLTYSNGKFTVKYYKKDEYSANFYNVYSSTVTYGEQTLKY